MGERSGRTGPICLVDEIDQVFRTPMQRHLKSGCGVPSCRDDGFIIGGQKPTSATTNITKATDQEMRFKKTTRLRSVDRCRRR